MTSLVPPAPGLELLHARHHLDAADGALRLALAVPWESPAADAFREEVAALRHLLGDDRAALDDLRRLVAVLP
ncbi:hypothetical protein [Isoptericola variabilis]|nr:hypothetical protein [Isoptericola variabilis]